MEKILALTDLHLRGAGQTIIGLDPTARLREALDAALNDHPDAKALILMGDLTHSGRSEEYETLREILQDCPIPVTYMLGNHDLRAPFRTAFPDAPVTPQGHVQHIIDLPDHRIITLDTHQADVEPHHAGFLCEDRLAWLDAALEGADGRLPLVFTHHPPHAVGLPGMDAIALTNGDALLERLAHAKAHLFCGHVHRTISGQASGVPFTMFKSTCHQAPLDLIAADSTLSNAEPAAYGLLLLSKGGVIAHSEDVGLNFPPISGSDALPKH
ncbi:3',5'-cyclic AMP phosphodiesterase CpdA [Octadecabacter temperatus]|uniref:3',5'-cyclic adenosine monophosphate phosphodiesterase CpdA n=1 Tax=Octadecabacter temperatus TaxID=1458307 RepID=A0A0K0Y3W6_9RHOB|nr:phosphodiesterase [Octadecabacter temperatus]AKS45634.1 3',5'-cyclic adenosine monophosphate phosphodiesterase CpdA [Octadecabacter temperatus]SIN97277.1 3',5'-cyclic AMP phosphodiesterase CpdA [Octadecabacter temperatus]